MSQLPVKSPLVAVLVHHYDELIEAVRRRFGDRHAAREVVHDLCVQLLEAPEKEGVRAPLALLHKIAHDRAISHHRSERRRQVWVNGYADLPDVVSEAPGPERCCASADELEQLCNAVAHLPPRCQQVFIMHKIHELPQQAVADQLGLSLKAVEKHVRIGMHKCRVWLSEGAA